uniref:Uncharacterized protein n=1 Tax=Romanomermis culicivorax TaxID=13658 RepID=A0A915HUH0_ROMCU
MGGTRSHSEEDSFRLINKLPASEMDDAFIQFPRTLNPGNRMGKTFKGASSWKRTTMKLLLENAGLTGSIFMLYSTIIVIRHGAVDALRKT